MDLTWISTPWALVVVLAAFRLTHLWITDELPPLPVWRKRLTRRIDQHWRTKVLEARRRDAIDTYDQHDLEEYSQPPLAFLLNCYWCVGFWVSLACALAASFLPLAVWGLPFAVLALSALVGFLSRMTD